MISQIVRLRQVVKRWKSKSLRGASSDSDEATRRTPSGSVAVYVGPDRRRFVIPTRFLNLPVFVALLDQAEEEFGFQTTGGLTLPCEPGFFNYILQLLDENEDKFRAMDLDGFLKMVLEPGFEFYDQSTCKESSATTSSCNGFTPLLHNTRV